MKKLYTIFLVSILVACNVAHAKLTITNTTDYPVTFRLVPNENYDPIGPVTVQAHDTWGKTLPTYGFDFGHYHIDVDFTWGGNETWSLTMKNRDKTTRGWGFSYNDTGRDANLEFRMNSDYNAPVLWDPTGPNPTLWQRKTGWWIPQRP